MWPMHDEYHWQMHWFWWIVWIIVALVIFALFWFIRRTRKNSETPLDILERRYAAGEIDTEEYKAKRRELERRR
ncbi:SHOCT domain-containing protein [Pontibacter locisalis]|uniref:SHOCT domain-containing protein n=1 Tax=Pontibacter locisalis TaxID=1719035 RepID=A0ABW5IHG5_9BACT